MATKPKYKPGDVVWFDSGYQDMERGVVTSKPIIMDGDYHVEVVYPERDHSGKVERITTLVPVSKLSEPLSHEDLVLFPSKKDKIIKGLEEFKMKLSKPAIVTAVVLGVIALLVLWFAGNYNDLVRANNAVENSKAKIDTELTRRYDLIDNIVSSVEGSQAQESDVFGKIAEARKLGGSTSDPGTQAQANETISTQIALLPRLQEQYPELRSNDQVTRLITELQGTNNTIRDVRNQYNDTVTNYNNNITSFPKSIFAAVFGFEKAELFEATAAERVNPKVEINPNER